MWKTGTKNRMAASRGNTSPGVHSVQSCRPGKRFGKPSVPGGIAGREKKKKKLALVGSFFRGCPPRQKKKGFNKDRKN